MARISSLHELALPRPKPKPEPETLEQAVERANRKMARNRQQAPPRPACLTPVESRPEGDGETGWSDQH